MSRGQTRKGNRRNRDRIPKLYDSTFLINWGGGGESFRAPRAGQPERIESGPARANFFFLDEAIVSMDEVLT